MVRRLTGPSPVPDPARVSPAPTADVRACPDDTSRPHGVEVRPSRPGPSPTRVPGWAVVSAALTPVALIGGWTAAAARQDGFDAVRDTISALAATGATDPWIMTSGLAATGIGHVVTSAGLRPLLRRARLLHAVGGIATVAVAALPVDVHPRAHGVAAAVAFGALSLWPALAVRRGAGGPERPAVGTGASAVLLGLLAWFVVELGSGGPATGLSERAVAGAQAVWPLLAVLALRRSRRGPGEPIGGA